jgi:hypothetical protein
VLLLASHSWHFWHLQMGVLFVVCVSCDSHLACYSFVVGY